ncbi:MAG: 50S ribosomal protein L17 [Ignavibacteriae bacterium]|nr:50S ribosomal protein L17 [Ignavibacteriota bacterium]
MRHGKVGRKLGRTRSHRRTTLSALSVSLIQHKKIRTTEAKAKETRRVVEKLITRAKRAVEREGDGKVKDVHARREVFSFLRDRQAVTTLFNDVAPKVATRAGGYTRVVKLGQRYGDGAHIALIELVDYNAANIEKASAKAAAKVKKKAADKEKAKKEQEAQTEQAAAQS